MSVVNDEKYTFGYRNVKFDAENQFCLTKNVKFGARNFTFSGKPTSPSH